MNILNNQKNNDFLFEINKNRIKANIEFMCDCGIIIKKVTKCRHNKSIFHISHTSIKSNFPNSPSSIRIKLYAFRPCTVHELFLSNI